jgi:hypothetical protein
VGVLEARLDLDFPQEPVGTKHPGHFRAQDFDGDVAVMSEVVGKKD